MITVCHHSASLVMPNSDPRNGFFYRTLTLIIDSYNIDPVLCFNPGTPTTPILSATPKTLVAGEVTRYLEFFQCDAMVGYPASGSAVVQTNKNSNFETFSLGTNESSSTSENCSTTETLIIKSVTFDASWNNTQLRCAIKDNDGQITEFVSEEYTVQLLPGKTIPKVYLFLFYACILFLLVVGISLLYKLTEILS